MKRHTYEEKRRLERMPLLKREIFSQDMLHNIFWYCPERGLLFRKPSFQFRQMVPVSSARWNLFLFDPAYNHAPGPRSYKRGDVLGVRQLAHRVIWKFHFGTEPSQIAHINGNIQDNRIENLKEGTSGPTVYFDAKRNCWRAAVTQNGKRTFLPRTQNKETAQFMATLANDQVASEGVIDLQSIKEHTLKIRKDY